MTLNCERLDDSSNDDVIGDVTTFKWYGTLFKLLLDDSTDPSQIRSAAGHDVHNAKLQSFCIFLEQCCCGETGYLQISP